MLNPSYWLNLTDSSSSTLSSDLCEPWAHFQPCCSKVIWLWWKSPEWHLHTADTGCLSALHAFWNAEIPHKHQACGIKMSLSTASMFFRQEGRDKSKIIPSIPATVLKQAAHYKSRAPQTFINGPKCDSWQLSPDCITKIWWQKLSTLWTYFASRLPEQVLYDWSW